MPEIGVSLPLAELYEGLVFEAEQGAPEGEGRAGGERAVKREGGGSEEGAGARA